MKGAKRRASTGQIWVVAGGATLLFLLLIGASVWSANARKSNEPVAVPVTQSDAELGVNGTTRGKAEARVELVEYSDFLCPGCAQVHQILEPEFEGMIESGQIRFVHKDFVLDGHKPYAQWAAEAARCAGDQGKFWAYRSLLFHNQKPWSKAELKRYAEELGLDTKQFNQCFDEGKHREAVDRDSQEARNLGLPGTPTYLLNGQAVELTTVDDFIKRLQDEVAKANGKQ